MWYIYYLEESEKIIHLSLKFKNVNDANNFTISIKSISIWSEYYKTKLAITVTLISVCQRINCKIECARCAKRVQAGSPIVPRSQPCLIRCATINIVSKHRAGPGIPHVSANWFRCRPRLARTLTLTSFKVPRAFRVCPTGPIVGPWHWLWDGSLVNMVIWGYAHPRCPTLMTVTSVVPSWLIMTNDYRYSFLLAACLATDGWLFTRERLSNKFWLKYHGGKKKPTCLI